MIDEKKLNEECKGFVTEYIPECSTCEQIHKQIKDFKIIGGKKPTLKQKAFALMYSRYIDFPDDLLTNKKCCPPNFFSDISNCFFDGFKVIHHSYVTREIHGYPHNFCNKQVRELTEKSGQYFSCIFQNGFRFDMTFLTKGIWLWQTQDVSSLGSGLTTLKSYNIGRHLKFIDSIKYYQQPLSKLARSTTSARKKESSLCF